MRKDSINYNIIMLRNGQFKIHVFTEISNKCYK
jgi:hypothetical protein